MRCMNRIILIGILLLLTSVDAAAQSTITGTVIDSLSSAPLPKASVMLMRGGRTILFARADNNGHFSLEAQAQPGDELQATCMGYAKHRQPVTKDNILRLAQQAFQLKEVTVQGPPVTQRRDTIVYDLTKFATERDNNLKDVLKKLPGVDVEKDGQIKYRGKAISRFTVEGLDLSKGQYNKLTDNIRAKDVKKAEVTEHDQPIKALRNRVFTDDIGMNIVLKDSARDQLFATLRPYMLADDPTHVGGDAVVMQIGKERQMETTVQYDRSGRDLSNQFSIFYNLSDFASTASMPQWFSVPSLQSPIDEERVRRNTSQAYSLDYLTKDKHDAENSISVSYNRSVIRQHTQNISQYYLGGQTPTQTSEDRQMTLRQDAFSLDYNHRINADNHYGNIVFKARANQDDGLSNYANALTQTIKTPELNLSAAANQTYTLGRSTLQWCSTADYHHAKDKLRLNATTDSASQTAQSYAEELSDNLWHTAHSLSWNRQYGKWHRNYILRLEAENLNIEHKNNTLLQGGLTPSWYYKDEDWRIYLTPGITMKRFTRQNANMLLPSASVYINRDYGNRANWKLGTSYTESTPSWETLALEQRRTDYRTWIDAPSFVPRTKMLLSLFEYNYKRTIYQFFSNVKVNWSRNWGNAAMDMTINDGNYHFVWARHNTRSDNFNTSVNLSKGWSVLHLKTSLQLNGSYSLGDQYSNRQNITYKYTSYGIHPEIIYSPTWMEVDYKGDFSFNRSKANEEWTETLANWTQRLTLTSTISHIDLSLSGVLYHNEMPGSPAANILLADAKLTWRTGKVRFSASLRNLFNKKTYDETTYSGVGIFTNRYWLRPRELMLNIQFSL